jgi:PAS domain-containing protein
VVGQPQKQATLLATAIAGTKGSAMGVLAGRDLQMPYVDRLFMDPIVSVGFFKDAEAFIDGNPKFSNERAGSNDSDPDDFIQGDGWDNFFRLRFKYLLPTGHGRDRIIGHSRGIRAGVLIPFMAGGTVHGVLTLGMVHRSRKWPPEMIRRYGMIAEIIANGLERKRSEAALHQSQKFNREILDSLNYHIVVLDRPGTILDVNESWKRFAAENAAASPAKVDRGADYLEICRRAADGGDPLTRSAVEGISSVLEGAAGEFTLEYPCHAPDKKRWFIMRAIPFAGRSGGGAIISHIENTERKLAEIDLRNAFTEIERLKTRLEAETAYLQEEIRLEHDFEGIIGRSPAIQYVLYKVEQVAATDTGVLVLGETGTGKELVCRAIHNNSLRKARPLVKVNCAALPANLIESELFGHERGAFTGAQTRRKGRFELADGGCIFLDEIGELPLDLQGKLLRVLQDGEFERLGSSMTIRVDVRVIAATNRDLESQVQMGRFREDLFYRLNVFPITVPPLRERTEDIPLLAQFFMEKNSKRMGKRFEFIPESVKARLLEYPWPGNVRELMNVIERAVISSSGPKLRLADDLQCRPLAPATCINILTTIYFNRLSKA